MALERGNQEMSYIFHSIGILCLINVASGLLAGDQILAVGRKAMPLSMVVLIAYFIWLVAA